MESNVLIAIGKRIAEIRKSHNITQETLADQLGVSPKHISHTECGKSSLSLKNLIEFCHLYDCSLDYIVSKLPPEISNILYTGTPTEIDRLNRYLQIYIELLQKQD